MTEPSLNPPRLVPRIEGAADGPTLFFVQGWPDDDTIWDGLVAALRDRYRCVRVNMPNYPGAERRRFGCTHDEIVLGLVQCIRSVSPDRPVTLVAHDWGAFWTYRLHFRHPELVERLVALDIAPYVKPNAREAAFIIAYQWWLIGALVLGGPVGDAMTRLVARVAGSPRPGRALEAGMNYPYLHQWKEMLTGKVPRFGGYAPEVPILYVYGKQKPAQFQTRRWLDFVRSRPNGEVVELEDATHWVQLHPRFVEIVKAFLDRTNAVLGR